MHALGGFALALATLAGPAAAQKKEKVQTEGLRVEAPERYTPFPVQPNEPWIVLRWDGPKEKKGRAAELYVLRIEFEKDPEPVPKPPPITTFARFAEQRLALEWKVAETSDAGESEGWKCSEHTLESNLDPDSRVAWAYELRNAERTWVLLGTCAPERLEKELRVWRRCAASLELGAPDAAPAGAAERGKWPRFYEKNPAFRNPEARMRVRERMVGDWEAEDSENYLIVYHTKKESLVNHLKKRLEGIRRSYVELFPPVQEITAVSTLRICHDQEEYHRYGGPQGSAGYWNPSSEELVLFVFDNKGGDAQSGKEDSRIVLLHEAFHQYIHYAVGEVAPHSWFNEGYGDYFSGAQFNDHGEVGRILPNPWRIELIQYAIQQRQHASWADVVHMEQPEFYGGLRSVNYAMGWSMIYFLNKCPAVKRRAQWARILPTYFDTLKAANTRERAKLAAAGHADDGEKVAEAAKLVREEAVAAAFKGLDLHELEEEWREFVLELKAPK